MKNIKGLISTAIITSLSVLTTFLNSEAAEDFGLAKDLFDLKQSLVKAGFKVKFEKPPMQGAYGLINIKKKTILIAPITHEMGIFRATFVHEAVHAAQTCRTGKLQPIGWTLEVDDAVRLAIESILYRKYTSEKIDIEREAFLMQGQTSAISKIKKELTDHCKTKE